MAIRIKLYAAIVAIFFVSGCQPSANEDQNFSNYNESLLNSSKLSERKSENMVYVTAIETDSRDGDAAAYRGTLNVINGCLFMGDMLVVIVNPNLEWEQNPFVIYNRVSNEKFKIGDVVTVGGSSADYSLVNEENLKWKYPPNANCKSKRVWLVGNMVH
ncbi:MULTISPECIES: hypothetical protein [unclassified Psychrobacter]|uniref:hypothetical protein n=1 Tax=unclassified Psychrobacter TaxID=196806 RepID=UPI000708B5F2|nr:MULTISPECIES: hypothetical protein [unclassified Psychrobacter]KRG31926.1 hypothetical protein AK824_13345 [Psychrobacter sp. P11G3]MDX2375074.1 hypothetical protein [Psychrobacter sp. PP-21]